MRAPAVVLTAEQRENLERTARAATSEQRVVFRARVVLRAAEGLTNLEIAAQLGADQHLHPAGARARQLLVPGGLRLEGANLPGPLEPARGQALPLDLWRLPTART